MPNFDLVEALRSVEALYGFSCFGSDDPQHSPVSGLMRFDLVEEPLALLLSQV